MVRTKTYGTWDLNVSSWSIANNNIIPLNNLDTKHLLRLSPELPYVYLPDNLYDMFVKTINDIYVDEPAYPDPICDPAANKCKFPVNCAVVKRKGL